MNPKSNQAPVAQDASASGAGAADATVFRALEEEVGDDMEQVHKSNNSELVQKIGSIQEV